MILIAFLGAGEIGLVFRVLQFPDLTVDGSFPLGAAVAATLIVSGWNPWLATGLAAVAGALAGLVTAWLNVRLKILHLLASILTMIALYSINLRIMGRPNVALLGDETVLTPLEALPLRSYWLAPILFLIVAVAAKLLVDSSPRIWASPSAPPARILACPARSASPRTG